MTFLLGVPAIAVGLSAISFSASLQKDAASIPNALAIVIKSLLSSIYPNLKNADVSFDFIKFILHLPYH